MRPTDRVTPFWFEFEPSPVIDRLGLHVGCGVWGYTLDDALWIVQPVLFKGEEMPEPVSVENHTW